MGPDSEEFSGELLAELTSRQRLVLAHFVVELEESCIARRMGLKAQTVRNHIAGILRRLRLRSRAELMKVALLAQVDEARLDPVKITGSSLPKNT